MRIASSPESSSSQRKPPAAPPPGPPSPGGAPPPGMASPLGKRSRNSSLCLSIWKSSDSNMREKRESPSGLAAVRANSSAPSSSRSPSLALALRFRFRFCPPPPPSSSSSSSLSSPALWGRLHLPAVVAPCPSLSSRAARSRLTAGRACLSVAWSSTEAMRLCCLAATLALIFAFRHSSYSNGLARDLTRLYRVRSTKKPCM
mmetsp:Transcript_27711/g.61843  ORF Transcript_27711/g.61843 Transcript_27711/m.61843 type:complete len:202 (-) Transcript_27711:1197-1802(-)